jgi:hypothetical protein
MQNRYVGDIGDFGKYGLLRALCDGSPSLKLGVVWYLYNPRDERTDDGKHTAYLDWEKPKPTKQNLDRFASCDGDLYPKLRKLVQNKDRNVSAIVRNGVLPSGTVFYDKPLTFDNVSPSAKTEREQLRNRWLEDAVRKMQGRDLVFLDPDNGLEVRSTSPCSKRGPKYVFLTEIKLYLERNQSVVIYQHLSRQGTATEQVRRRRKQLWKLPGVFDIFALRYHRGTGRVFFVLASRKHSKILRAQTDRLLEGLWAKHFQLING